MFFACNARVTNQTPRLLNPGDGAQLPAAGGPGNSGGLLGRRARAAPLPLRSSGLLLERPMGSPSVRGRRTDPTSATALPGLTHKAQPRIDAGLVTAATAHLARPRVRELSPHARAGRATGSGGHHGSAWWFPLVGELEALRCPEGWDLDWPWTVRAAARLGPRRGLRRHSTSDPDPTVAPPPPASTPGPDPTPVTRALHPDPDRRPGPQTSPPPWPSMASFLLAPYCECTAISSLACVALDCGVRGYRKR